MPISGAPADSIDLAALDADLSARFAEALVHHRAGRLAEALWRYDRILSQKPDLAQVHSNRGLALAKLGRLDAAADAYRQAIALKPDHAETLSNCGVVLVELNQHAEAEQNFRRAIALKPDLAGAHNNLGLILKEKGQFTEALQATKEAIRLAPKNTSYYASLGAVRTFEAGDSYMTALEAMADDAAALSIEDRVHLHFALGKAYEQTGQYESAFQHLLAGNALKRRQIAYDEGVTLARMERTRALFTRHLMRRHEASGEPSAAPVFVVGMARSGTTLIEQILASHPAVFGAGELMLFEHALTAVGRMMPGAPRFPEMVSGFRAEHLRSLARRYLENLLPRAPAAPRIVDKMPANFHFAGLIHLALPNATIIHAVRDPLDTCVSCFSVNFTYAQSHTFDLAELGRHYLQYRALMAHWHDVLPPGRVVDVHYEELVGDLESAARRIVAACGLDWDSRCLDFHRTERPVRTTSAVQVRQPIYDSSIGRWRRYEKYLGPLIAALDSGPGQARL
jgi:tetratricopeptide (TPR) repeat protein